MNNTITANTAYGAGGGGVQPGTPDPNVITFDNNIITLNSAHYDGGGVNLPGHTWYGIL